MNTLNNYINTYLEHCKYRKRLSAKTLKAFFHYLEYIDTLSKNHFLKLDIRFREPKLFPRTISAHTIQNFLSTLYSLKKLATSSYQLNCCIRDIAVVELLFATGMRISELCTLRPENIDFANNTILIYGKGSKECILQIGNPDVLAALSLYKETFQEDIKINTVVSSLRTLSILQLFFHKLYFILNYILPFFERSPYELK